MLKNSIGLANSSSAIAAYNASEIDILFLKYGIIFTKILLQYGLDLFNPSSSMSSVRSISHLGGSMNQ
jgi:hypothetical protein